MTRRHYYENLLDLEGLDPLLPAAHTVGVEAARQILATLLRRQRCDLIDALITTAVIPKPLALKVAVALQTLRQTSVGMPVTDNRCSPRACAEEELLQWRPVARAELQRKLAVEIPVRADWLRRRVNSANAEEVVRFYRETESYIWELMAANNLIETLFNYGVTIQHLTRLGVHSALDYGAGIGSFVLAADAAGITMTHMDLPSPTLRFATWRYAIRQRSVRVIEASGCHHDIPKSEAIICTEVVEHVSDPLALLNALAAALPSGGIVAVSESCAEVEKFASHLPQNRWLAGGRFAYEMQRRGFRPLSVRPATKIMLFERTPSRARSNSQAKMAR